MDEKIINAYSTIFKNMYFTDYQKGIDTDGWYSNERNDKWLPILPHQIPLFEFRNGNKELRPKSLIQNNILDTSQRMSIAEEITSNYSLLRKDTGIFTAQLFSAMEDYLRECTKQNKELKGL